MLSFDNAIVKNEPLFRRDPFLNSTEMKYGAGDVQLDLKLYTSLFKEFNLIEVGFGRKFFPNDKNPWCRWTFEINEKKIDVYSCSFNDRLDNYPTFIIDFDTYSTNQAVLNLFQRLNENTKKRYKNTLTNELNTKDFIRTLFNNFLYKSMINHYRSIFNDFYTISDVHFVGKTNFNYYFSFSLNDCPFTMCHSPKTKPLYEDIFGNGETFTDIAKIFNKQLEFKSLYIDKKLENPTFSLFDYLCEEELLNFYKKSDEYRLMLTFNPSFVINE